VEAIFEGEPRVLEGREKVGREASRIWISWKEISGLSWSRNSLLELLLWPPGTPLPISESKSRPPRQWIDLLNRSGVCLICHRAILPTISSVSCPARLILGGRPKSSSFEYDSPKAFAEAVVEFDSFCP
jgi:hypothetical protein